MLSELFVPLPLLFAEGLTHANYKLSGIMQTIEHKSNLLTFFNYLIHQSDSLFLNNLSKAFNNYGFYGFHLFSKMYLYLI